MKKSHELMAFLHFPWLPGDTDGSYMLESVVILRRDFILWFCLPFQGMMLTLRVYILLILISLLSLL